MLSNKAKYGLKALMHLAGAEGQCPAGDMAKDNNIPRKFLDAILVESAQREAFSIAAREKAAAIIWRGRPKKSPSGRSSVSSTALWPRSLAPAKQLTSGAPTALMKTPAPSMTSCST